MFWVGLAAGFILGGFVGLLVGAMMGGESRAAKAELKNAEETIAATKRASAGAAEATAEIRKGKPPAEVKRANDAKWIKP